MAARSGATTKTTKSKQPSAARAVVRKKCKIVVVCAPKGGVGKTTIIRSMLVAAAKSGIHAIGINMDQQETLARWGAKRDLARDKAPGEIVGTEVVQRSLHDYRQVLSNLDQWSLAFFDTPPGHTENATSIRSLCEAADLIIIPTGASDDDLAEVIPFREKIAGSKGVYIFNKVNPRTGSFKQAQIRLLKGGRLCPMVLNTLEDVHKYFPYGLTALDFEGKKGGEELDAIWNFVRTEVSI